MFRNVAILVCTTALVVLSVITPVRDILQPDELKMQKQALEVENHHLREAVRQLTAELKENIDDNQWMSQKYEKMRDLSYSLLMTSSGLFLTKYEPACGGDEGWLWTYLPPEVEAEWENQVNLIPTLPDSIRVYMFGIEQDVPAARDAGEHCIKANLRRIGAWLYAEIPI